jgi:hypothetical protein
MRQRWIVIGIAALCFCLATPTISAASTGDLKAIIEGFVIRHFPDAKSHLWVVNDTQWDGDEMIVDVFTYVVEKNRPETIENRYLLLIVEGKLTAAQRVPLNPDAECQPEEKT